MDDHSGASLEARDISSTNGNAIVAVGNGININNVNIGWRELVVGGGLLLSAFGLYKGFGKGKKWALQAELLTNIPNVGYLYVQRQSKMTELINCVSRVSSNVKQIAITGIDGSGKTELALAYARQHHYSTFSIDRAFYIRKAPTWIIDASTIKESYELFANGIGIKTDKLRAKFFSDDLHVFLNDEYKNMLIQKVNIVLKRFPGWQIIFDNVVDYKDVKEFIPNLEGHYGTIFIITQNRNTLSEAQRIDLSEGMLESEAVNLLSNLTGIQVDSTVTELVRVLDKQPFLLVIAGLYIRESKITYASCVEKLKQNYEEMEEEGTAILARDSSVHAQSKKTTRRLVDLSLQKLSPLSVEFLYYCSLLNSRSISREILSYILANILKQYKYNLEEFLGEKYDERKGSEADYIKSVLKKVMAECQRYGLLNPENVEESEFFIHQSSQRALQAKLKKSEAGGKEFVKNALEFLWKYGYLHSDLSVVYPFSANGASTPSPSLWSPPHVVDIRATKMMLHFETVVRNASISFDMTDQELCDYLYCLGRHYLKMQDYDRAITYLERTSKVVSALPALSKGKFHESQLLREIATAYRERGKSSGSTQDLDSSIAIFKLLLAPPSNSIELLMDYITHAERQDLIISFYNALQSKLRLMDGTKVVDDLTREFVTEVEEYTIRLEKEAQSSEDHTLRRMVVLGEGMYSLAKFSNFERRYLERAIVYCNDAIKVCDDQQEKTEDTLKEYEAKLSEINNKKIERPIERPREVRRSLFDNEELCQVQTNSFEEGLGSMKEIKMIHDILANCKARKKREQLEIPILKKEIYHLLGLAYLHCPSGSADNAESIASFSSAIRCHETLYEDSFPCPPDYVDDLCAAYLQAIRSDLSKRDFYEDKIHALYRHHYDIARNFYGENHPRVIHYKSGYKTQMEADLENITSVAKRVGLHK